MNIWHDMTPGEDAPNTFNLVVEIPKGSQNKYEYDKDLNSFKLDRVLFSPFHYPGDYGFIPQTLAEDGDPADGLVLMNFPTYPGIVINVRPIGLMPMVDNGEGDNKLLCVPEDDVRIKTIHDIGDVEKPVLDEIAHFFATYKQLEGKTVEVGEWQGADAAKAYLEKSLVTYKEKYSK